MALSPERAPMRPLADPRFLLVLWSVAGLIGWAGLLLLGAALLGESPPKAGHDLRLVLEAGSRIAAREPPYDPALVNGTAAGLAANDLFYAYPPPVAQAASVIAGLPFAPVLLVVLAGAVAGFAAVAVRLARRLGGPTGPSTVAIAVAIVALVPFLYPLAAALIVGNLDAYYPLLYGLMLLAMLRPATGTAVGRSALAAGAALALASVKVHPASLGLWFAVRALAERRSGMPAAAGRVLAVAAAVAGAIVVLSLAIGGPGPWRDYLGVVRTASGADLVLGANVGPAAQLSLLIGGGESLARTLHLGVVALAVAALAWSAWRLADPVESLAVGAVASLVVLPVTWFHYPPALLPFAVAAWARSRGGAGARTVTLLLAGAAIVASISIALPVTVWVAVGLVLAAIRSSRVTPPARAGDG